MYQWCYQKTVGDQPSLFTEGSFLPSSLTKKEGCPMVTYSELIQLGILIVGIIGLFMAKKEK